MTTKAVAVEHIVITAKQVIDGIVNASQTKANLVRRWILELDVKEAIPADSEKAIKQKALTSRKPLLLKSAEYIALTKGEKEAVRRAFSDIAKRLGLHNTADGKAPAPRTPVTKGDGKEGSDKTDKETQVSTSMPVSEMSVEQAYDHLRNFSRSFFGSHGGTKSTELKWMQSAIDEGINGTT